MGASFPLLPEFTLSPFSVFPSVIVQILTPVSSPTSLVGMFVYFPVYICLLNYIFSLSMSFHTGAEALDSVLSFIFSLTFKSRF